MKSNKKFVIILEILVITFLVMSVVPVCGLSDFGSSDVLQDDFSFYAVYDRLVDLNSFDFTHAAMSGDGNKLIYFGRDKTSLIYAVYTVNTDGTGLTQIALPDLEGAGIGELAIDHDGSRAFFKAGGVFCKVENGVATKIFDSGDYPDIGGQLSQIQTTADGGYVYFLNDEPYDNDVWRVAHSGGSPELIIDDVLVQRDGGVGKQVQEFAISDNGSTIVFALHGYAGESGYRSKCELFVRDATGGYRQLTNDDDDVWKVYPAISGDGSTIVFYVGSPQYKWYSIKSDGSAKIFLEDGGYNTGGPVLNYDGTKMFYNDQKANGGRLVNTDGSGGIDLFPVWDGGAITIAARTGLCISDYGHRLSFISYGSISIMPSDHVVYIGYLDNINAVPDAPIIESIAFDPPAMPRGDPDAVIVLTSEISAPQGLADIKRTITDELVDGRLERRYDNIPVRFYHAANDVGRAPDETAGDGIFSSAGTPAPKIDELDQMTVRMGVEDASGTVVVADTVLFIGEVPPTPAPSTEPTTTQVPIDSTGSRTTPTINVNRVDYAVVGVMYVDSPDSPPDAAGSDLPQEITVDLEELGLDYVETIYLATQNAWSFDMPNDIKVATLVCEYAEGGPHTTLDLIMGVNTAEWSWENPTMAAAFGAQPPHSMPPVITSTTTTCDSDQEYNAHTYAASVSLDPTRTLSNLRLELVDANQLLGYRSPINSEPTWLAQACMAVTLEGRVAPTPISIDEATHAEMIDVSQNGAALYNDRIVEVGEEKARQDTVIWLKEQDIIADAGLSEDCTTIWIDYANGVKGAIFTASQEGESAPVSFSSLRQDYRSLNQVSMMATNLRQDLSSAGNHPNMVGNRLAIVLCPFEHEIKGPAEAATDQIRDHLRSCGFSVEYISNQEVNVKLLRDINRYGVIYLATHGGIRNEEMVLSSGEKPTTKRTNDFYAEDIVGPEGRIGIGTLGHSKESYYIVFPSFFSHYSGDTGFPKSLVYISACNSLKQEDMANAFLAKGVAAYIGYKGLTTIGYAVVATDEPFFRLLAENCITVDEAKNADTTPFLDKWIYMYGYGTVTSRITPWSTRAMNYTGDGKTVICEEEETSDGDFHCPIPIPNEAAHWGSDRSDYWLVSGHMVGPYYLWYDTERTKKHRFHCYNIEGELHELAKGWYEDGTPDYERNYKDGKKHGVCKEWSVYGKFLSECNYEEGNCVSCVHGDC